MILRVQGLHVRHNKQLACSLLKARVCMYIAFYIWNEILYDAISYIAKYLI